MKKVIALLITAVMLFGAAACETAPTREASGDAGRALADKHGLPYSGMEDMDPIEFTVWIRNPNTPPRADNPILDIIEQITNVKINFQFLVGEFEQVTSVMLASGDWADAAFLGADGDFFLTSGQVLPLQDLIEEHAPNLRAHYDPWWNLMHYEDGNLYIAEIYGTQTNDWIEMEHWQTAFWLQKDVVDHFGRAPKDLDEYFDFIREYMALHPTIDGVPTMGFEILTEDWRRFCIDNPPMFLAGYPNWGTALANEETNTAYCRWTQPWTKDYYKKLNEEFHNGLINAETLTLTYDQYIARIASGAVLGIFDQRWNFNPGQLPLIAEGRFERTYLPFDLTNEGVAPRYTEGRPFTGNNGLVVNVTNPDPVRFVMYMDYIVREEVQRFLEWGIEGEHWFYNENGRMERPDEQRDLQRDQRWQVDNLGYMLRQYMPKMEGTYSCGNSTTANNQPEEYFASLTGYDRDLFERLGIQMESGFMSPAVPVPVYFPFWSMTLEDGSPPHIVDQRIEDVNVRMLPRLVVAPEGEFDAIWDEYQAALLALDRDALIEEINRQIQVRLSAFGSN